MKIEKETKSKVLSFLITPALFLQPASYKRRFMGRVLWRRCNFRTTGLQIETEMVCRDKSKPFFRFHLFCRESFFVQAEDELRQERVNFSGLICNGQSIY